MTNRYRNRISGEIRDVTVGSAEETTVLTDVYTENGVSLPQWVPDAEWEAVQSGRAAMSNRQAIFGNHSRRLTPGEIAMGIKSYDQKVMENDPNYVPPTSVVELVEEDEDETIPETTTIEGEGPILDADPSDDVDPDEEEDEEDDDDTAATAPVRKPRRAPRRAAARSH